MTGPIRREEPTLDGILGSLKQGGGAPTLPVPADQFDAAFAEDAAFPETEDAAFPEEELKTEGSRSPADAFGLDDQPDADDFDMSDVVLDKGMPFAAFLSEGDSGEKVVAFAEQQGWDPDAVHPGTLRDLLTLPAPQGYPRAMVVDVDGLPDVANGLASLLSLAPESRIVAVGSANDIQFYRELQDIGVADYLVKPLDPALLQQSFTRLEQARFQLQTEVGKKAKIITVIGARGGVGASTLAVNLAWGLSQRGEEMTAFLDLDLHFGVASLALDLEPGRGLRDILAAPERLDSLLVGSAAVMAGDTLSVWSAEDGLETKSSQDGSGAVALVEELAKNFGEVVVDMPRHLLPHHRQFLDHTDEVLLVSDLSLAGVRDCTRILAFLRQDGRDLPVKLVLGRIAKDRPGQVDRATFERSVKEKVSWVVPEDAKTAAAAANAGKPLKDMAKRSPLTLVIEDIVRAFDSEAEGDSRRGLRKLAFWRRKS
ncbi:AAA family ATPase [Rhodovibrionaceae bacterium A322]